VETLFTVSLLELFIGGGGRMLEVGPITVRMILFAACLCASVLIAVFRPRRDDGLVLSLALVTAYLAVHLTAFWIGAVRGNDLDIARTEMQQSLYWLAAPFLAVVLQSRRMVLRAAWVVRAAGIVLAVAYIGFIGALAIGMVGFDTLHALLSQSEEFAFRSESYFFYKGFLYLGIAAIFFLALRGRHSVLWLVVLTLALAMTLTRGFVLSTAFAALLTLAVQRRWQPLGVAMLAAAAVAFFIWGYLPSQEETLDANRDASNSQRVEDFRFIVDNIKISTLLFGEGLGALINGRVNIENTFLWAVWRLGFVGLLFWLTPLLICTNYFLRIARRDADFGLACAFFFSTILVYVQTMANPYLNNPIGLSFVIVALFSLRTLSRPARLGSAARAVAPEATRPRDPCVASRSGRHCPIELAVAHDLGLRRGLQRRAPYRPATAVDPGLAAGGRGDRLRRRLVGPHAQRRGRHLTTSGSGWSKAPARA
jgi:hypothetical protein